MSDDTERSLAEEIRELKDIQEITRLKARYCRCVDLKDWAGYASLLMDDYYFDSDGGVYEGRDNVVAFVSSALRAHDHRPSRAHARHHHYGTPNSLRHLADGRLRHHSRRRIRLRPPWLRLVRGGIRSNS